jgi:hypothetical protein
MRKVKARGTEEGKERKGNERERERRGGQNVDSLAPK